MDYIAWYLGLYRDYYRDPFPHSLLSTREFLGLVLSCYGGGLRMKPEQPRSS